MDRAFSITICNSVDEIRWQTIHTKKQQHLSKLLMWRHKQWLQQLKIVNDQKGEHFSLNSISINYSLSHVQLTMSFNKFNNEKSVHFFQCSVEEWIHIYVTVHVDVKHSIFPDRLVQQFDGRHAFMIVIIMRSTKRELNRILQLRNSRSIAI